MTMRTAGAVVLACVVGCGPSTPPPRSEVNADFPLPRDAGQASLAESADVPPAPPAPAVAATVAPVHITAGERRAVPTPLPRVAITAPRNGATVREDRVEVRLNVQHWRDVNDPNDHRHIHLVLDNEPYRRVDDPRQPVVLEHLSPGTHVLRAFPGWDTHETVKENGAYASVVFNVGRAATNFGYNPRAPMLTYSRPKGEVNGADADRVLLDFYLTNVPASEMGPQGFRVRPTIDGNVLEDLPGWVPYYIENLPDGPHTIGLQLIGRDGAVVAGPFGATEQRITVNHAAAPAEAHGAMHAGATGTVGAGPATGADAGASDPAAPPAASETSAPPVLPGNSPSAAGTMR